jgi:hypothetical protein
MVVDNALHLGSVADICLVEGKTRVLSERSKVGTLAIRVVIVVEVIDADHFIAAAKERFGQMTADETGHTGYKYFQRITSMAGVVKMIHEV